MSRFKSEVDYYTLSSLYRDWIKRNGDGRDCNDQRFGQFLCSNYLLDDVKFPELFYEESAYTALCKAMVEL